MAFVECSQAGVETNGVLKETRREVLVYKRPKRRVMYPQTINITQSLTHLAGRWLGFNEMLALLKLAT